MYVRLIQDYQASNGGFGSLAGLGGTQNWPQLPITYEIHRAGPVTTLIHTFGPSKVNEVTFGVNRAHQTVAALTQGALDNNNRQKVGLTIPQFYPQSNPANLIPNATFGGGSVPNNGNLGIEGRFPYFGTNNIWDYSDTPFGRPGFSVRCSGRRRMRVRRRTESSSGRLSGCR